MSDADFPIHEEIPSGESAALINLLNRAQFKSLRRAAWLPVTKELKTARWFFARRDSVKATGSGYGGVPWLGIREAWPLCQYCKRPMQFFFQINLQETPTDAQAEYGDGLVQFFYCTRPNCVVDGEACDNKGHLIRYVEAPSSGREPKASEGEGHQFSSRAIVEWMRQIDGVPHLADIERLGIQLTNDEHDLLADWGPLEVGDKLGGWPAWIQDTEEHRCSVCDKEMRLFFQFNPDVSLKYSFNQEFFDRPVDLGCAWFLQCPYHRTQMKFTWQCH